MTNERWEVFKSILDELKVKPFVNVIHAGDASKPTGLMVRVVADTKFRVEFAEEKKPEPQFKVGDTVKYVGIIPHLKNKIGIIKTIKPEFAGKYIDTHQDLLECLACQLLE